MGSEMCIRDSADRTYRAVSLGHKKWKSLIGPQASLHTNCNKEGFNVVHTSSQSKARIGIIANNKNDCLTCDSRIGYGTGGLPDDSNTCGSEATIRPDNGEKQSHGVCPGSVIYYEL